MRNTLFQKLLKTTLFFALLGIGAASALAWTGPLVGPPGCTTGNAGCDPPINMSANTQAKSGTLNINMPTNSNSYGIEVQGGNNGIAGIGGTSFGLYGQSTSGIGIAGYSTSAQGVYGNSASGDAIYGSASGSGTGIRGNSVSGWGGIFNGVGGIQVTSSGSASTWTGSFVNSSSAYPDGLYVQNPSAYSEIAYGGYGLWTNGSIYSNLNTSGTSNPSISTDGNIMTTGTGDIYDAKSGKWLSTISSASGFPFEGGYAQYPGGGCPDPNYAAGSGCGCPSGSSPLGIGSGTCSASACNIYVCY